MHHFLNLCEINVVRVFFLYLVDFCLQEMGEKKIPNSKVKGKIDEAHTGNCSLLPSSAQSCLGVQAFLEGTEPTLYRVLHKGYRNFDRK